MVRFKALAGVIALSALAAACSGGGSESSTPAETTESETSEPASETAETPAAPADSGTPAADDVATLDGVEYASLTGSAEAGKKVFAKCRTCHVTDPGVNRIGPSMAGILGSQAGAVQGFNYTDANKNSGITWTEEKMFQYLEKPQRVIPKTKMVFAGLPDAQQRADVIAYLKDPS